MLADVCQAQRHGLLDQCTEHAATSRQRPNRPLGIRVDSSGDEASQLVLGVAEYSYGGVTRLRQLERGFEHAVQYHVEL
jgi:hypothetical protein